jgi:hypothetical protein
MPDFSQNFNRYSYCLNNPLIYVDESGEFFWIIPNISWSKSGGLSIGISVIVGIPGVASAQAGIGYNLMHKDFSAYVGATAAFNTVNASYSTQSGFSVGWSAGLSPQMGFPISSNFTSVGANYNISHNAWSGNVSAWNVDKTGWTFDPSFSAMVLEEHTTNFARGQGFRNNNQVLQRFVANNQHQKALEYFGFDGTYRPKKGAGAEEYEVTDYYGSTNPETGNISYGDLAFDSYDILYNIYVKELYTQRSARNGTVAIDADFASDPNTMNLRYYPEEALGFRYAFKRNGLFYKSPLNNFKQANSYWIRVYGTDLINKRWWHFIYTIPRRW